MLKHTSPTPPSSLRRIFALSLATLLVAGFATAVAASPIVPSESASAASLNCGQVYLTINGPNGYITHGCSGKGKVQYTVKCIVGQNQVFTAQWNSSGMNRVFQYRCGWNSSAYGTSWKIIG